MQNLRSPSSSAKNTPFAPENRIQVAKNVFFVFLFELSREKFFSARYAPIFFMNSSRSIMPIARAAIFSLYLSMNSEAR